MKSLTLLAVCTLFISTGTASAASTGAESPIAPPTIPDEPANVQATLHRPASLGISFGPLRVRFEKTTLEDARRQIGVGSIANQGDAGDSISWLCYTIPNESRPMRLWITSGELEGNTYIDGVTAEVGNVDTKPVAACPALPARFRPVALDRALWLGVADADVDRKLGRASHEGGGWRMFDYTKPISHGQCERQNWLWTKSRAGRVILLDAGQISSC